MVKQTCSVFTQVKFQVIYKISTSADFRRFFHWGKVFMPLVCYYLPFLQNKQTLKLKSLKKEIAFKCCCEYMTNVNNTYDFMCTYISVHYTIFKQLLWVLFNSNKISKTINYTMIFQLNVPGSFTNCAVVKLQFLSMAPENTEYTPLFSLQHTQLYVILLTLFFTWYVTPEGTYLQTGASGAALFIKEQNKSHQICFGRLRRMLKGCLETFPSIHCTADKLTQWQSFPDSKT